MRLHQAILLSFLTLPAAAQTTVANKTEIIAYVFPQNRILGPAEVAATKLTRINYAFANVTGGKVVEGFAHDRETSPSSTPSSSRIPR